MKRKSLRIKNRKYDLPIYLPDATRAVVRSLDSEDLKNIGVEGVVVNTYHLMTQPGTAVLKKAGGIKKFMNFDGLVVSDSGGWQIFSLLYRKERTYAEGNADPCRLLKNSDSGRQNSNTSTSENKFFGKIAGEQKQELSSDNRQGKYRGEITNEGVIFGLSNKKKEIFTPEKSIQVQFDIGSDIIICLDDFTDPKMSKKEIGESVKRTILWAKNSRKEFDQQIKKRKLTDKTRPHLFAVIQGGWDKNLRKYCAEELLKIGFDGYGYGGYTVNEKKEQDLRMAKFVAELIPDKYPKFALGSGRPSDIAKMNELGWDIFDCVLPTRDARHQRLYTFKKKPKVVADLKKKSSYEHLYIKRGKFGNDQKRICQYCDCSVCQDYSRAYLHHLFKIKDFSAHRLATTHNLSLYSKVMKILKKGW